MKSKKEGVKTKKKRNTLSDKDENGSRTMNTHLHYTKTRLVDQKNGEWHWSINEDGSVNHTDDKAGFWKCPYHNTRMCLEIMERM